MFIDPQAINWHKNKKPNLNAHHTRHSCEEVVKIPKTFLFFVPAPPVSSRYLVFVQTPDGFNRKSATLGHWLVAVCQTRRTRTSSGGFRRNCSNGKSYTSGWYYIEPYWLEWLWSVQKASTRTFDNFIAPNEALELAPIRWRCISCFVVVNSTRIVFVSNFCLTWTEPWCNIFIQQADWVYNWFWNANQYQENKENNCDVHVIRKADKLTRSVKNRILRKKNKKCSGKRICWKNFDIISRSARLFCEWIL